MKSTIRAIGEIALRVNNLNDMVSFYETAIGLELMRRDDQLAFFKIADGIAGHTQVLALFDRQTESEAGYTAPSADKTTVDHIAFTIAKEDFQAEDDRLKSLGHTPTYAYHDWVQWRSLYVLDPDGNTVELVCHDPK